jgi:hypothetical protein
MSDLKISPGYATIEEEFEASLRRAFVDGHTDFIILESRRERFRMECAAYGQKQGWLTDYEEVGPDEQSLVWILRLTEVGKKHFGLL